MACILNGNELTLNGDVGFFEFGDGFTVDDVVLALAQVADEAPLTIMLNSGGGYATDGATIYAVLSRRTGPTDIVVEGIAASAASLIAMAGDTITMSAGSIMMVHDPSAITVGNVAAHGKTIEMLEALATSYARVYATKTGKTEAQCRALMKRELWMEPEEAVEEGFADRFLEGKGKAVAAFDYSLYAAAPKALLSLAREKNWSRGKASRGATEDTVQPATNIQKETSMSKATEKRADNRAVLYEAVARKNSATKGKRFSSHDAAEARDKGERRDEKAKSNGRQKLSSIMEDVLARRRR